MLNAPSVIVNSGTLFANPILTVSTVGANGFTLGITSNTPNSQIVLRTIAQDNLGNVIGINGPHTFVAGATPDWQGSNYLCINTFSQDCVSYTYGDITYVKADSIFPSGATFKVSGIGFYLPGSQHF